MRGAAGRAVAAGKRGGAAGGALAVDLVEGKFAVTGRPKGGCFCWHCSHFFFMLTAPLWLPAQPLHQRCLRLTPGTENGSPKFGRLSPPEYNTSSKHLRSPRDMPDQPKGANEAHNPKQSDARAQTEWPRLCVAGCWPHSLRSSTPGGAIRPRRAWPSSHRTCIGPSPQKWDSGGQQTLGHLVAKRQQDAMSRLVSAPRTTASCSRSSSRKSAPSACRQPKVAILQRQPKQRCFLSFDASSNP